jgi:hypothetical protein
MRRASLFALFALFPAAVTAATPSPRRGLEIAICTGDGVSRSIPVPASPPGDDHGCLKGCHAGCSRKRETRRA